MEEEILVVDDEELILELVREILELENYSVLTAHDGYECLKILDEKKPSLLLLDIMMPGMDGKEVCKRIRKDLGNEEIKIAFLTALQKDSSEDVFMREMQVHYWIEKPFTNNELTGKIKNMLKQE